MEEIFIAWILFMVSLMGIDCVCIWKNIKECKSED